MDKYVTRGKDPSKVSECQSQGIAAQTSTASSSRAVEASVENSEQFSQDKTYVHHQQNLDPQLTQKAKSNPFSDKLFESWKKDYSWIKYDESKKAMFCTICCEAVKNKLPLPNSQSCNVSKKAFVEDGFHTWKNATSIFNKHQISELHKTAVILTLNARKPSITEHLSTAKRKEMMENRTALNKIFSTIMLLAKQGLAFRGHEDKYSNLHQLLLLRCEDVPELKTWMARSGHKWLHHEVVNEIIALMANEIRKLILNKIMLAKYYSIMIDETSDITRVEQVSICIRIVNDDFSVNEYFMGFFETKDTKSETLYELVTDFLATNNLNIKHLRGQCYDGASNMSGRITGLQTRIRETEPRALFVHCSAHSLSLCVQDSLEDLTVVRNVIGTIKDLINFIRDSPKRLNEFKELKEDDSPLLSAYCPTRWAQIEILNAELQRKDLCVNESHASVCLVKDNIQQMRDEEKFNKIWSKITSSAEDLGVEEPCLKRPRKIPKRIDSGSQSHVFSNVQDHYVKLYYEVIDQTMMSLNTRFENDTMKLLNKFENFVTGFAHVNVEEITNFYNRDLEEQELDGHRLVNERDLFLNAIKNDKTFMKKLTDLRKAKVLKKQNKISKKAKGAPSECETTIEETETIDCMQLKHIVMYLQEKPEVRAIFPQYSKLIKLLLTIPGSSCSNERSFSSLRRLKTYLRSTMLQQRLNDTSIMHIYRDMVSELDLDELLNTFIKRQNLRMSTFAMKYKS
ncbi:zinc finger MYM-type protein 1-like [Nasonia vitripennis]|uniref:Uncharacterized protein n=1 Tax=Nasonia vitripennis TaxID=7425 RepID=A0A7M7Q482_NASVI|nr:zinc finger MYM-type protein 1-like [Nasonia vitripennis]